MLYWVFSVSCVYPELTFLTYILYSELTSASPPQQITACFMINSKNAQDRYVFVSVQNSMNQRSLSSYVSLRFILLTISGLGVGNGVALVSPLQSCNKCTVHSCLSKAFGNAMCMYQLTAAELVFQNTLK